MSLDCCPIKVAHIHREYLSPKRYPRFTDGISLSLDCCPVKVVHIHGRYLSPKKVPQIYRRHFFVTRLLSHKRCPYPQTIFLPTCTPDSWSRSDPVQLQDVIIQLITNLVFTYFFSHQTAVSQRAFFPMKVPPIDREHSAP